MPNESPIDLIVDTRQLDRCEELELYVNLLLRYVDHLRGCASYTNGACTCGFENAMRELNTSRASVAAPPPDLAEVIKQVIHRHNQSRTHKPTYCCPEDEAVYNRLLTRMLVDGLSSVAVTVDAETDTFFCENCEKNFTEKPHATADGYWLCDPCHESLKDEAAI